MLLGSACVPKDKMGWGGEVTCRNGCCEQDLAVGSDQALCVLILRALAQERARPSVDQPQLAIRLADLPLLSVLCELRPLCSKLCP